MTESVSRHRERPRPDEPVFDQGLQFDLATVFTRRRLLSALGLGAGAVTLAACGRGGSGSTANTTATSGTTATTTAGSVTTAGAATTAGSTGDAVLEIPDETNGPYPADGSNGPDILEESGVVRRDLTSSFGDASGVADGVPLTFSFTVLDMANGNVPFAGAAVYAWHCDAEGQYSMYSSGLENENYLRGVQVADADGKVTFTSIFPGCYSGRWPHIHFEVYPDVDSIVDHDNCIATSQAAFTEASCNDVYGNVDLYSASIQTFANVSIDSDGIFTPDTIDQQMFTLTGNRTGGYTGSLVVPVDTTTEPTAADSGGGPGAGGPGGGGSRP
jgi:protocatechuate 3,4-dioxygenase beta subunit